MNHNLSGRRFGRLTVTDAAPVDNRFECVCDCGNVHHVEKKSLVRGTQSCGCLRVEAGRANRTHGETCGATKGIKPSSFYVSWCSMISRCCNTNGDKYHLYGGRGIKVCERWRVFECFRDDMFSSYAPGRTLDRLNNDGDYEPVNCRWATQKEQCRNKRNNVRLSFNGETKTLVEWSETTGLPRKTITDRIRKHGWSIADALTVRPIKPGHKFINAIH